LRIDKIFTHWIDLLASLLVGAQEAWRIQRSLVVMRDGQHFCARGKTPKGGSGAPASPLSDDLVREARQRFVILELPTTDVVRRRIAVPAQAREFTPGIVRNQIERLSPWRADQVTFGFAIEPQRDDANVLDVHVSMAARDTVEAAREQLSATGLAVDRIVAAGLETDHPITLWSRLGDASEQSLGGWRRRIAAALIGGLAISVGTTVWALVSTDFIRAESDDVSAQAVALQRRLEDSPTSAADASRDPAKRAWMLKQTTPAAVMILETLSQSLPDSAYITDLSLNKGTLRVTGLCSDAPSLLAPLQNSGLMTDVHFFAPTTRSPDGTSFQFHIETTIQSRAETKEK
jgi:general secretion pathway protein L